ncbi:MAG: S41 family peptidase [Bacteroidales bacterium]
MKKILFFCILCLPILSLAETLHFPNRPTLSPDGSIIYFPYNGDIFKVPAAGGLAVRIVSLGGNETNPRVSPNGKLLAFSSDIQGNNDVYIVPVTGGDVKRLTFHESSDYPISWSSDSKSIYFESNRANIITTYKISIDGGTPYRLFPDYFNTIVDVAENPVTKEIYFTESSEGISFPTRKRYIGDNNANIQQWNPAKKEYKELTNYNGKDLWPMVDKNGTLYYVSDEYNKEANIVKYNPQGKAEQLTTFKQSLQYPSISYDGLEMVFLLEYKINYLNLKTGKVTEPQIIIADNNVALQRSFADEKPRWAGVSPDGKKFAFSIRGLLFVSDTKGEYLKQLNTPANERVTEVVWGPDNKTIYYLRTNKGYSNIFKIAADGSLIEKPVYITENNISSLTTSKKWDKIAFICGSKAIMMLNTGNDSVEKLADAQFWAFQDYNISFSPNDSYIAFEAVDNFEGDIYVYSLKEKKLTNLTKSASSEGNPCFSPNGKDLYLVANLYSTVFPRGGGSGSKIYKLPLQRYNEKAFKSDIYDKLFVTKDETKKDTVVNIDFKDIFRRMEEMNIAGRNLYTYSNKEQSWLLYTTGKEVYALKISDEDAKPKVIKDLPGGNYITSKTDLYSVFGGNIYKIDFNQMKATKTEIKKSVEKNLKDEFTQMFYEAWAAMEQNYYDVKFHGTDWKAKKDYYASLLPYVKTRRQLRTLINDMLGELNSSHQGFSTRGKEEGETQTNTFTAETGIIWQNDAPYTIDRVLTDSPANSVDIDLKPGDLLIAVNGEKVVEKNNRESYFISPVKQNEIKLTFKRGTKEFDVKLHTISYGSTKNMLYTEWEDTCRAKIDKLSNGRIAYIHMRDMGDGSLMPFLKAMHTDYVNKDALILDLRYNNGGNVHKEVLDFLRQKAHFTWSYRDFPQVTHPNVTPADKPIIVLVNERSLSDAEVTSNGIRSLGIAKIIGTETYRWIIFTSGVGLIDGSSLRLPAWGCYSLDGKDLEFSGVKPDIYVKNTFQDRLNGKDPQLECAVKEILKQLK